MWGFSPTIQAAHTPSSTANPKKTGLWQTIQEDFASAEHLGILTAPPADAGRVKKLWVRSTQLVAFYFRGVAQVVTNVRTARDLRKRVRSGGAPLTRAEWLLVRSSVDDIKRLAPFALTLLILEEALETPKPIHSSPIPSFQP